MVMVQKMGAKWWMCIDFTNLNATYPKVEHLLLNINVLVDAEKTAFITGEGLFYNQVMPFGLKMWEHLLEIKRSSVQKIVLVKSKSSTQHIRDLKKTFASLRRYNM